MAKIESIVLKTSDYSQQDLFKAMTGESQNGTRPERLEQGEIVLRYTGEGNLIDENGEEILDAEGNPIPDKAKGVEMWTLNEEGDPTQIRLDLSAEIPEYDLSANIGSVELKQLRDVDIDDPVASQVLTWDGAKWVNRDLPEFGGEGSIIPTLNEVGDVNYGIQAAINKFGPENGDILFYSYDNVQNKYVWGPYKLEIDLIDGLSIRQNEFVVDRYKASTITIGNPVTSSIGEARFGLKAVYIPGYNDGAGVGFSWSHLGENYKSGLEIRDKSTVFYLPSDLILKDQTPNIKQSGSPGSYRYVFKGIKYETLEMVPETLPDDTYLATLKHVKNEIGRANLGDLQNVNDFGILQGQVLGWDSLSQTYRPLSGIAPDLSLASIEDLEDVSGRDRGRGFPLTYQPSSQAYVPERVHAHDVIPAYYVGYSTVNNPNTDLPTEDTPKPQENLFNSKAPACDEANLGRVSVFDNQPHICLRCREYLVWPDDDQSGPKPPEEEGGENNLFSWVRMLVDGYNTVKPGGFSPKEYRQAVGFNQRLDSLSLVAYEGGLGALNNVSTADVFPGSTIVYNPASQAFEQGYPAIYLPDYSIGELADVNTIGAGVGYGLLWNGEQWEASSLDQKIRLDDLQDVQFGALGVTNTKLVAAYMMAPSAVSTTLVAQRDVSTILAVSTQKADFGPGTTLQAQWSPNFIDTTQPPSQGGTIFDEWRLDPAFSLAELLDLYLRWDNDPSWQTIDGDGCIELFFYPTLLLADRQIFRKNIVFQGQGGYHLMLTQGGGLVFSVIGPGGSGGLTMSTAFNTVSTNNWHHVAMVKEGSENRLYLDGYLVDTAVSAASWTGDGQFIVGRNDLNDNNGLTLNLFRGYMSDLRVTKGRAKYSGNAITIPASIEEEIVDTTPNAGDFLSYDGTKWTNVSGVEGDISNKSIDELSDVNTRTETPQTGDALVWTGAQWEPGIPGLGATWALDDFTDVETFYQSAIPTIRWSQAERTVFANAFYANKEDNGGHRLLRVGQEGYGQELYWSDCDYTCKFPPPPCGSRGPYGNSDLGYINMQNENLMEMRALKITIKNKWNDCSLAQLQYNEAALFYDVCPDRDGSQAPYGDIPDDVPDQYIPCWGVIEDHIEEALAYGNLGALKNVSSNAPTLGQALSWTGVEWAPSSEIAADISKNSISDLGDVTVSGPIENQTLKWDGLKWINEFVIANITELPDVQYYQIEFDEPLFQSPNPENPAAVPWIKDYPPSVSSYAQGFIHGGASAMMDIGDQGLRGLAFGTKNGTSFYSASYLYNLQNNTTILTAGNARSGINNPPKMWMELNPTFVRFSGRNGTTQDWGEQGFLLGDNLYLRYENGTRTLANYGELDVAPKGLLLDYVDEGLQNLDLSRNILENLGSVNTTGKLEGWALIWDGNDWVASPSVAADISLSSIGDLNDVTKVTAESITIDVPKLLTSAPAQTNGGIELISSDGNSRIGWSDEVAASPILENKTSTFSGGLKTQLAVEPQQIRVGGDGGIVYINEPGLSEQTVPSYRQVKEQIVRELTDLNALLFLNGNSYEEQNYGWDITVQVTTQPSPALFSQFNGESSYALRKVNQDKFFWTTGNGCPLQWSMGTLWAFEMWVYISSTDPGDEITELIMSPVGSSPSAKTNGLHFGIDGQQRNRLYFFNGPVAVTGSGTASGVPSASGYASAITKEVAFDQWHHMILQQEGSGLMRWYVDGAFVGERQTNVAPEFVGGISFGGRENPTGAQTGGYFTGFIDDIRITKGWLPYPVGRSTVPRPVEPLPPGAFKTTFGTLNSLSDVNTNDPAPVNGNVLMWDNIAEQWKPGPSDQLSYDISSNVLNDLSDVNTQNQVAGEDDVLRWNSVTDNWERTKIDGNGGLKPISARSATPGQVPSAGTLFAGEIFINMADKKAYTLDSSGQPFVFATEASVEGILASVDRVVGGTF